MKKVSPTNIRSLVTAFVGPLDMAANRQAGPTIYAYHSIENDGWRFSNTLAEFDQQLAYLTSYSQPITLAEIAEILEGKKPMPSNRFAITFDDGYRNILDAVNICKKYAVKPTVFVIADAINYNREVLGVRKELLSDNQLKYLIEQGWEIGSHTMTHDYLTKVPNLTYQILDSKRSLQARLNTPINYISYPKGDYNQQTIEAVEKANYLLGLTMDIGYISAGSARYHLPRIGVDGSHSLQEFKMLALPSVVAAKAALQKYCLIK